MDTILAEHCHDTVGFWVNVLLQALFLAVIIGSIALYAFLNRKK